MSVSRPIVVAAVCFRDESGRVLAVRKQGTDRFMLPGGKLEAGESAAAAAIREVREEIGLEVSDVEPLGHWVAVAANEPGRRVESSVFTADLPGEPRAAAEIAELLWLDPAAVARGEVDVPLAPLLRDHVLPALGHGPTRRITVVGIGADGWSGVADHQQGLVKAADVLLGGTRHLELVPPRAGQVRRAWPSPLREGLLPLLEEYADHSVVALASGDPLVSGIGTTLLDLLGRDAVELHPALSSVALAGARMGWPSESVTLVSLVGRDPQSLLRFLTPGSRLLVLSSDPTTPSVVAALLVGAGFGATRMTALGDLGSSSESRVEGLARSWSAVRPEEVSPLHVLALDLDGPVVRSWAAGLPDDAYEHDGQLTKRDLRASALARLMPQPGQLLWDVGAGAGSVGIEWALAHPTCRTVAVEQHPERAARVARNAARLGVPGLEVVTGAAPESLAGLEKPDAIFVGGGATRAGVIEACRDALAPGGRLVVHGVTIETEALLARLHTELGGELTRISIEHAEPIGTFTGWTPARAVTQWAWTA
ncbi:precorrin-6y C5,15-methyltransferase (decarboxylating) subunit CbiE [Nocardioides sp.]|uniref:precorrin-6y C5,15-methyltransferase (decarboxylating) subunit CbiE n=1 Tax=Nocardioides sp. TaxID=35761 RepID=UPI00286BE9EB|nr:precorrin-6y C5,15-methyltransferase (decarboxylating) subunit CbiE [Nocardioides sp.]